MPQFPSGTQTLHLHGAGRRAGQLAVRLHAARPLPDMHGDFVAGRRRRSGLAGAVGCSAASAVAGCHRLRLRHRLRPRLRRDRRRRPRWPSTRCRPARSTAEPSSACSTPMAGPGRRQGHVLVPVDHLPARLHPGPRLLLHRLAHGRPRLQRHLPVNLCPAEQRARCPARRRPARSCRGSRARLSWPAGAARPAAGTFSSGVNLYLVGGRTAGGAATTSVLTTTV